MTIYDRILKDAAKHYPLAKLASEPLFQGIRPEYAVLTLEETETIIKWQKVNETLKASDFKW